MAEEQKREAPIQIQVPVEPWGQIPMTISLKGITLSVQTEENGEVQQQKFVQTVVVFATGEAIGFPIPLALAEWLFDTGKKIISELKTGLQIASTLPPKASLDGQ